MSIADERRRNTSRKNYLVQKATNDVRLCVEVFTKRKRTSGNSPSAALGHKLRVIEGIRGPLNGKCFEDRTEDVKLRNRRARDARHWTVKKAESMLHTSTLRKQRT